MLHLRICLLFSHGPQATGARVVDGSLLKHEGLRSFSATVALIHNPGGRIASGILLPGGRYALTAAHVVGSSSAESVERGLIHFSGSRRRIRSWGNPFMCTRSLTSMSLPRRRKRQPIEPRTQNKLKS